MPKWRRVGCSRPSNGQSTRSAFEAVGREFSQRCGGICIKEQAITRLQGVGAVLHNVVDLAVEAEDKLLTGVNDRAGTAVGAGVQGDDKRFHRPVGHSCPQILEGPVREGSLGPTVRPHVDESAPRDLGLEQGRDRHLQGVRDPLQRAHAGRDLTILD